MKTPTQRKFPANLSKEKKTEIGKGRVKRRMILPQRK
jgi:hypothetical protein